MPNPAKQKIKLLYLMEVLLEKTDEENHLSATDLIEYLSSKDIQVERKTIFADIATLKEYGLDIEVSKSKNNGGYYIASRDFELAEIKLIIEALLASKFISAKKTRELICKLSSLVGPSERKSLSREVFVQGRVKTDNESIYYNVDILHNAMSNNHEITFVYFDWNKDKELVPRKNGELYRVSPWALTIKDEYYYLIAYDDKVKSIKHYRVDKMKSIDFVKNSKRLGKDAFAVYDIGTYTKENFGMFSGEEDTVTLLVPGNKIGIIIDRFGKEIDIRPLKDDKLSCRVNVMVSKQFFGWIAGIGQDIQIAGPANIKEDYCNYLRDILNLY